MLVFGGSRFLGAQQRRAPGGRRSIPRPPDRAPRAGRARQPVDARLQAADPERRAGSSSRSVPAKPDEAAKLIEPALVEQADAAAESFGHIRYRGIAERAARRLAAAGAEAEATTTIDSADRHAGATDGERPAGQDGGDRGAQGDPRGRRRPTKSEGESEEAEGGRRRPSFVVEGGSGHLAGPSSLSGSASQRSSSDHRPGTPQSHGARCGTPRGARSRTRGTRRECLWESREGSACTCLGGRSPWTEGYGEIVAAPHPNGAVCPVDRASRCGSAWGSETRSVVAGLFHLSRSAARLGFAAKRGLLSRDRLCAARQTNRARLTSTRGSWYSRARETYKDPHEVDPR